MGTTPYFRLIFGYRIDFSDWFAEEYQETSSPCDHWSALFPDQKKEFRYCPECGVEAPIGKMKMRMDESLFSYVFLDYLNDLNIRDEREDIRHIQDLEYVTQNHQFGFFDVPDEDDQKAWFGESFASMSKYDDPGEVHVPYSHLQDIAHEIEGALEASLGIEDWEKGPELIMYSHHI
jgi:hypothetical protein